ncbi:MAG: hypothetical protein JKX69_11215 [Rhodobacteraceae bacterium]|nr:hypothetical protein [Paracoccaceae bacterium]
MARVAATDTHSFAGFLSLRRFAGTAFLATVFDVMLLAAFASVKGSNKEESLFIVFPEVLLICFLASLPVFFGALLLGYPACRFLATRRYKRKYSPKMILLSGCATAVISGLLFGFLLITYFDRTDFSQIGFRIEMLTYPALAAMIGIGTAYFIAREVYDDVL